MPATFLAGKVPELMLSGAPHLRWLKEHFENTGLDLIRRLRCPALICQGSKDALVSVERDAKVLYQAADRHLEVVADAVFGVSPLTRGRSTCTEARRHPSPTVSAAGRESPSARGTVTSLVLTYAATSITRPHAG
jgi:hypothetical protein